MPKSLNHPARLVPIAFLCVIILGTGLLMLPIARAGAGSAPFMIALFTATSAVCVTGLAVQDTATYWSSFGHAVILALFQIGGFGIMSGATLLGLLVTRRLRLSTRLVAQAETRGLALGDVVDVLKMVLAVTLVVQAAIAVILALRLHYTYGEAWADAAWNGVFQSVSAFNNAGLATYSDGMAGFARDPVVLVPIMLGVILGGIGMPVLHDLRQGWRRPSRWSLHTKITLMGTAALLPAGMLATLVYEWGNPATLGALDPAARMLNAAFHSVMARSGGFNAVDVGQMRTETLSVTYGLMLIGGGSAGTAGGIKVGTFVVILLIIWAEIRGEPDSVAFGRRVSSEVQRQAVTIVLLAVAMVGTGTLLLLTVTGLPLQDVLFETISAFATVGLSTGITPQLPPSGQALVALLMFIGRVGTITVATGLALRGRQNAYRYPEERPIVG
ncbi:TrkH family potassium uptake protein [Humitalea sp. 24SJ18S-53]|uniref:TrkH family potassium uptake protein n=1 Tax=Humitalea sp. 24SJ18S-53 TaxID=3422307 RepID=UPI003D66B3FF